LAGELSKAKAAYDDLFVLWKQADSEIPILREVKTEYEQILIRMRK